MRVLVTGGNGFIGRGLIERLLSDGITVASLCRGSSSSSSQSGLSWIFRDDFFLNDDWSEILKGVDVIVHCAGKSGVTSAGSDSGLDTLEATNVELTRRIAREAANAGVRRFIFLSSVKAVGEHSSPGRPLSTIDPLRPEDEYGASKFQAEMLLRDLSGNSSLEVVIVRPPVVYGPHVKGNFLRLMGLVARGVPLPLGAVDNSRSMVFIDNLVDFLCFCIRSPLVANKSFFVSDGHDLSTRDLVLELGNALGCRVRVLPFPVSTLQLLGRLLGKSAEIQRLVGTLQVDITPNRELGWIPPYSVQHGLLETTRWFINRS